MPILQRLSTLVHRAQGNQLPNQSCPSFPYKLTVTIPYHTYHTPTSHIHYHKPNIVGIHTAHVTNKNKQKKTENMKTRARDCDRKKTDKKQKNQRKRLRLEKTDTKKKRPEQEVATGKKKNRKKKQRRACRNEEKGPSLRPLYQARKHPLVTAGKKREIRWTRLRETSEGAEDQNITKQSSAWMNLPQGR